MKVLSIAGVAALIAGALVYMNFTDYITKITDPIRIRKPAGGSVAEEGLFEYEE